MRGFHRFLSLVLGLTKVDFDGNPKAVFVVPPGVGYVLPNCGNESRFGGACYSKLDPSI